MTGLLLAVWPVVLIAAMLGMERVERSLDRAVRPRSGNVAGPWHPAVAPEQPEPSRRLVARAVSISPPSGAGDRGGAAVGPPTVVVRALLRQPTRSRAEVDAVRAGRRIDPPASSQAVSVRWA